MAGVAPKVSVEVCEEGELIRRTVSDNGPGIPPETMYKILNLYIRTSEKAAYHSATRGAQGQATPSRRSRPAGSLRSDARRPFGSVRTTALLLSGDGCALPGQRCRYR
jgi:hypothetical protein